MKLEPSLGAAALGRFARSFAERLAMMLMVLGWACRDNQARVGAASAAAPLVPPLASFAQPSPSIAMGPAQVRPEPAIAKLVGAASPGPVKIIRRKLSRLVSGNGDRKCEFSVEYPEINSGQPSPYLAVNQKLAPAASDFSCGDELEWDGDNGLNGSKAPKPKALSCLGNYRIHYNAHQLLAVTVTLSADVGRARNVVLRHDTWVLDLAAGGAVVPLSGVVNRGKDPAAWAALVGAVIVQRFPQDEIASGVVTGVTIDSDTYVVTNDGVSLCPGYLPQAFDALRTCDYTLTWEAVRPFWIAGNPVERARGH